MSDSSSKSEQPLSATVYAVMALIGGLVGIALLLLYVYEVPRLIAGGITDRVFYLLLIPWALSVALCLFGAMRSYARYSYKQLGHALELGGPVVVFCLVVVGGFRLVPPPPDTFDLTIRTSAEDGSLIRSGDVWVDVENDRRHEQIGANGEANIKGISQKVWGVTVTVRPHVEDYEDRTYRVPVNSQVIDLLLERSHPTSMLTGTVVPAPGTARTVTVFTDGDGGEGKADEFGRFRFSVKGKAGEQVRMKIYVDGKIAYDDYQTLPGPVTISIRYPD